MATNQPKTLSSIIYTMMKMDDLNNYEQGIPPEIMALTQAAGFDINEQDEYGNTALHALIQYIYMNRSGYDDDHDNDSEEFGNRYYKTLGFVLAEYLLKNFNIDFSLENTENRKIIDQLHAIILILTVDMDRETGDEQWRLIYNRRTKILWLLFLFKLYEIKQETENPINQTTLVCLNHFSEYQEDLFADVFEMIADMNIMKARDYMINKSLDAFTFSEDFSDMYDGGKWREYVFTS